MKNLHKVLIIRLSSIGDILLTTPLIRILKRTYSDCRIDYVIKRQYQDLIAHHPGISKLYVYDKQRPEDSLAAIKKQVKQEHYDVIIDIHRNFRSFYLRTCAHAGRVVRFKKYVLKRWLLVHLKLNLYNRTVPVYQRYINSMAKYNIVDDDEGLDLFIPADVSQSVDHRWHDVLNSKRGPIVGIAPGASYLTKRWIPQGFHEVAEYVIAKYNATIIFFGNSDDREVVSAILQDMKVSKEHVYNLAGELSLMESASLLNYCDYLITNDTGLMHMATAFKVKVVAIFGSTTQELGFFPCSDDAAIVQHIDLKCRPCSHVGRHKCPEDHFKCMHDITAAHVIDAFESLK
ncbi:lipopolysaccharide heptosyltransferase II [candidate division KSB1 bacterium]|nr:lipopolysaccharide heptosyltransferase II [candidate division KSB1 bacterium]